MIAPESTTSGKQAAKSLSAAQRRARDAKRQRWLRLGIQILFFVLAPGVFSGAFNAVKYAFTQIGAIQGIEVTAFVVQLLAVLAFTFVFGRFFCGYACAFGTLGDVLYRLFELLRSKTPIPRVVFPDALVRVLSLLKYAVLVGICVACVAGVWATYSGYSPWVAFAAILAGQVDGVSAVAFVLLGAVALGMVLRERFFCQFLCPLGAVFSLMPVLGFSEYTRNRQHCARNCGKCRETCPVSIWPDGDSILHGECISCGRCSAACPMANVNLVAREKPQARAKRLAAEAARVPEAGGAASKAVSAKPLRKTPDSWFLLNGTNIPYVLIRTLALLAVFWVVGATRYLPSYSDVLVWLEMMT